MTFILVRLLGSGLGDNFDSMALEDMLVNCYYIFLLEDAFLAGFYLDLDRLLFFFSAYQ